MGMSAVVCWYDLGSYAGACAQTLPAYATSATPDIRMPRPDRLLLMAPGDRLAKTQEQIMLNTRDRWRPALKFVCRKYALAAPTTDRMSFSNVVA